MKMIVVRSAMLALALAMALFAWADLASAQDGYVPDDPNPEPQLAWPGSLSGAAPAQVQSALGFGSAVDAQPSSDGAVGGTGGGLAVTGSDVSVPLLAGIAFMGVGGVSLVASRRREF